MKREIFSNHFPFAKEALSTSLVVLTSDVSDGDMFRLENRERFLRVNGISGKDFVLMVSNHRSNIKILEGVPKAHEIEADAIIAYRKGLALGVLAADCYPVQVIDPKGVVGFVHAGWRELRDDILGRAIAVMRREFGTNPVDVLVRFGPGICQDHYQVGPEVAKEFEGLSWRVMRADGVEKSFLDLIAVAKIQLMSQKVPPANIVEDGRCTFEDGGLFSHRRSTKTGDAKSDGRFLTLLLNVQSG